MVVVGREGELAQLDRLLEEPDRGFAALVLDGPAGMGKTTLWDEALRRAQERGFRVLATRAAQAEVRLTYVALTDLLRDLTPAAVAALPAPQRRALAVALLQSEPKGGPLAQRAVAAGFLRVLEQLAERSPVLVAVDDAQWLDSASAALVEFAARRLRSQPVRVLLSQRDGEPEPFPFEHACRELTRVRLGPMSLGALHQLIRLHTGTPLYRHQLVQAEQLSGGNPLFAIELARAFNRRPRAERAPPPLPATLGEALLARVRALPPSTREALLAAALSLEHRAQPDELAALSLAEEASIIDIGAEDVVHFTHPLFAWAVERSASVQERRAAHAALARRVTSSEERVRHLALAAPGPDLGLAAALEQEAEAARSRGAPSSAATLLAEARRLTPQTDTDAWARLLATEIPLLLEAGDWERAWSLGQEALEQLPPGRARAAVLIEACQHRPGAEELCLQARAEAGDDAELCTKAEMSLALQRIYAFDGVTGLAHARTAITLARQSGSLALLTAAVTIAGVTQFLLGTGEPIIALEEALGLEEELGAHVLPVGLSARCYRALWLGMTGELDTARPELEELLAQSVESGDEGSRAQLLSFLGALDLRAGNLALARSELEEARDLCDLMEFAQGSGEKRGWLAVLLAQQGDLEGARSTISEGLAICTAIGDKFALTLLLQAQALVALSLDDHAAALAHIAALREAFPVGREPPLWVEFEGIEIEALVAAGRRAEASERVAALAARGHSKPLLHPAAWAARGESLLLAADGDVEGALRALDPLLARADLTGAPLEHGRTLLLKGQLERRAKHKAAARETLERAAAVFDELGASLLAEKARRELERVGLRRSGGGLSTTERRVAALVAQGKTNRQIASDLFISRRTVEANVARIYRKLGVSSRAELATLMAGGATQAFADEGRGPPPA